MATLTGMQRSFLDATRGAAIQDNDPARVTIRMTIDHIHPSDPHMAVRRVTPHASMPIPRAYEEPDDR